MSSILAASQNFEIRIYLAQFCNNLALALRVHNSFLRLAAEMADPSKETPRSSAGPLLSESSHAVAHKLQLTTRFILLFSAFGLALLPSVLKLYETSHWFREGDPSKYDNGIEWFANPDLAFSEQLDDSKKQMRIHYFIFPYMLMAAVLVLVDLIPRRTPMMEKPRAWLVGRSMLNHTFSFPKFMVKIGWPARVSTGEVLGVAVFLFLNISTMAVRVTRSLPRGSRKILFLVEEGDAGKEPLEPVSWGATEVWAKTIGVVTILNLGWYLLMPIGRRSVLLEALGLSWERAVKYHRWVGFWTVTLMFVHGMMYIAIWIHGNGNPTYDPEGVMVKHNLVPWGCSGDASCDEAQRLQLRVNIYGIVVLLLVLTMTAFALPWVRRHKFEWFYYAHHLFILVIVFVCLHYSGAIIYLIPGIAIYSVDKFMGLLAYLNSGYAETTMVSSDVLEVAVKLGHGVNYQAGQYVFLNLPDISFLEWHPFSLTSAPNVNNDRLFFHIKEAGTWTKDAITSALAMGGIRVRIDGFYGHNVKADLQDKQGVVLVGGGIGVTPMMSLAMDLCETETFLPVTLLWVVRTVDEFNVFANDLSSAMRRYGDKLTVKVWITLSRPEPNLADEEQAVGAKTSSLARLETEEQYNRILKMLPPKPLEKRDAPESFVMDHPGLGPPVNALVQLLSMLVALTGYALSQSINNKNEIEPADKLSLIDMTLVCTFVFALLGLFVSARHAFFILLQHKKVPAVENNDEKNSTSVRASCHTQATRMSSFAGVNVEVSDDQSVLDFDDEVSDELFEEQSVHDFLEEASVFCENSASDWEVPVEARDDELLKSMIVGRIGARPDLVTEFHQVAAKQDGADIGVLACGPLPMVETINSICNTKGCFSWGRNDKDSTEAFFAFTEEDWEW